MSTTAEPRVTIDEKRRKATIEYLVKTDNEGTLDRERKHYAVLQLRERLQTIHDEFMEK